MRRNADLYDPDGGATLLAGSLMNKTGYAKGDASPKKADAEIAIGGTTPHRLTVAGCGEVTAALHHLC
jgi:hypothetical protein